jgi:hypothetical protein
VHEHAHEHVQEYLNACVHEHGHVFVYMFTFTFVCMPRPHPHPRPCVHVLLQVDVRVLVHAQPKVGKVPTFRASHTDTDLSIVSADLFHGF